MADQIRSADKLRRERISEAVAVMRRLCSDDERQEAMAYFCKYCGCDDPRCRCWNDE